MASGSVKAEEMLIVHEKEIEIISNFPVKQITVVDPIPGYADHVKGVTFSYVALTGASAVDVERPRRALDNLFGDHHLLDTFEARQIEHGVKQNALHDRAQPPA